MSEKPKESNQDSIPKIGDLDPLSWEDQVAQDEEAKARRKEAEAARLTPSSSARDKVPESEKTKGLKNTPP